MPLQRDRKILGRMDKKIFIHSVETGRTATGGPKKEYTKRGPYWAFMDFLTRKQGEIEVETRITSIQQVKFVLRHSRATVAFLSKAGKITVAGDSSDYEIISVSPDLGRAQYVEVITEVKE